MSASAEPKSSQSCRRLGAISLVLLVLAIGGAAAALTLELRRPSSVPLRLLPEVVDLGALRQLETRQVELEIRNDSDHSVNITDVATSCGCTVPAWKQRTLQPRQHVNLPVDFGAGNGDGVVERTVTVYARDDNLPGGIRAIDSRIRALVRPDLVVEPPRLDLGDVPAGESTTASVRIKRHGMQESLELHGVRTTHECLLFDFLMHGSGDEAELNATFNPSLYPNRYFSGEIHISTNAPGMPVIKIPVNAKIQRMLLFSPTSLFILARDGDGATAEASGDLRISQPEGGQLPDLTFAFGSAAFEARPMTPTTQSEMTVRIMVHIEDAPREMEARLMISQRPGGAVVASIPVRYLDLRESTGTKKGE